MTTSYRGPEYPLDANRRRLAITAGITARSLAVQGTPWTWLVYVHPDDPLLTERRAVFEQAGAPVVFITPDIDPVDVIDWSSSVLTTRIDDDDAFVADAFRRLHRALRRPPAERSVLMFPVGFRVNEGRSIPIWHPHNAWSSLYVPPGDRAHIRMAQHHHVDTLAPIRFVDRRPAFLWVRHPDTETPFRGTRDPITDDIRRLFAVDWSIIDRPAVAA